MYTVDNIGITFHGIFTVRQVDYADNLWEVCDFILTY